MPEIDNTEIAIVELHEKRGKVWVKVGEMDVSDYTFMELKGFEYLQNLLGRVVTTKRRLKCGLNS